MTEAREKSHKGRISRWRKHPCAGGLGYKILGVLEQHPEFKWAYCATSPVEKHDEDSGEVETRNSRYTLAGKAQP